MVPLLVVIALVAAGGSIGATAAYLELRPASSGTGPHSVTVTDDLGRTVTLPSDPARIVVLSPNIMDIVVRLGLRSHVVGVDCSSGQGLTSDYSPEQVASWNLSTSLCVGVSPSINVEGLLAKAPGLVLASTIIALSDIEELSVTEHLPVVVLAPPDLGGIVLDVEKVGELFGLTASSPLLSSLRGSLETELDRAAKLDANLSNSGLPIPTVLVTYYVYATGSTLPGYFTFGPGTFGQSLVELAGGTSISANATTSYPFLTGSQVLYDNPSRIICGVGFGLTLSSYQAGPDWAQFTSVRAGNVTVLDSNLLTEADPTMILKGLPALEAVLHPGS